MGIFLKNNKNYKDGFLNKICSDTVFSAWLLSCGKSLTSPPHGPARRPSWERSLTPSDHVGEKRNCKTWGPTGGGKRTWKSQSLSPVLEQVIGAADGLVLVRKALAAGRYPEMAPHGPLQQSVSSLSVSSLGLPRELRCTPEP